MARRNCFWLNLPAATSNFRRAEHAGIGDAIVENPCGVPLITPHGFVFLAVRAIASGESNRAEISHIPRGTNAFIGRIGRLGTSAKTGC